MSSVPFAQCIHILFYFPLQRKIDITQVKNKMCKLIVVYYLTFTYQCLDWS